MKICTINNFLKGILFFTFPFSFFTFSFSQEVRILKNANSDPIISIISPDQNHFIGDSSGMNNTGPGNSALGMKALFSNTTGSYNTAVGHGAMRWNTIGNHNATLGSDALFQNS